MDTARLFFRITVIVAALVSLIFSIWVSITIGTSVLIGSWLLFAFAHISRARSLLFTLAGSLFLGTITITTLLWHLHDAINWRPVAMCFGVAWTTIALVLCMVSARLRSVLWTILALLLWFPSIWLGILLGPWWLLATGGATLVAVTASGIAWNDRW